MSRHRIVWEEHHGPIPHGLHVLHECDNPPCENVEHLFLGTAKDNARDRHAKGRTRGGNVRILTDEQIHEIRLRAEGETQSLLKRAYGVSQPVISQIVNCKKSYARR